MSTKNQMTGRRGEKRFDTLCSDAGVTCNKSVEDDYGWDKLIEFPPRRAPFAALDMQPGAVIAAVQVKTTTGNSRSVKIRLSNALHYVRSPLPQFLILIVLDGREVRYFAKHVWAQLIAEWLRVAREADAKGVIATNREKITVTFAPEDECGTSLLRWIEQQVEEVKSPYASSKKLLVDTVGFESGQGSGNVTFALDGPDALLDLQLGLMPRIKAQRLTFTSERFGIRARQPELDLRDVDVELTPEGRACSLRLEFPQGATVTVPSTLFGADNGIAQAFRVATRTLDVVFGPNGRARAKAHLDFGDRVEFDDFRAFLHLLSTESNAKVSLHINLEGRVLDMGSITMNGKRRTENWPWAAAAADVLREIAADDGTPLPTMSLADFNETAADLEVLGALACNRFLRVDFAPLGGENTVIDGFLAFGFARVGDQMFSAVASRPLLGDSWKGAKRQVFFGSPKLLWGQVSSFQNWSPEAAQSAYQRHLDRCGPDTQFMALGDLAKFVRDEAGDIELRSDLPTGRTMPLRGKPHTRGLKGTDSAEPEASSSNRH